MIGSLAGADMSPAPLNSSSDPGHASSSSSSWDYYYPDFLNSSSPSSSSSSSSSSPMDSSSSPSPSSSSSSAPSPDLRGPALSSAPPPLELVPWDVALCVAGTLISCENALVVAALFYTPALRSPTFVLIGSLAASDLLAGLALVLNFAVAYLAVGGGNGERYAALLSAGLLIAAFSASVLNILAITVDRFLTLSNALTYHTERTVTFARAAVAAIWAAALGAGLLPALGWNCLEDEAACSAVPPVTKGNALALAAALLLVLVAMTQLYLQICRIAHRHAQQIAVQHRGALALSTTKGVSTLSAILGAFAACWLPFAACAVLAERGDPAAYVYAAALPAACGSAINPVVYAFRNPDVRRSLWLACCGGWCGRGRSARPHTSSDV